MLRRIAFWLVIFAIIIFVTAHAQQQPQPDGRAWAQTVIGQLSGQVMAAQDEVASLTAQRDALQKRVDDLTKKLADKPAAPPTHE